jgi:cholesterol transport system auxiliary component
VRRRSVLALALAAGAGGCAGLAEQPARALEYDLGPAPGAGAAPVPASAPASAVLVLELVQAAGPLEDVGMLYRLDYEDSHQLRAYTASRWSAPIALLVRSRLAQLLAPRLMVLAPSEAARRTRGAGEAEIVLRLELLDFSQRFDSPSRSAGEVRLRATALRDGSVAQRTFTARRAAAQPNAAGGVQALAGALEDLAQQLVDWLQVGQG